jgi:hypothetical protein
MTRIWQTNKVRRLCPPRQVRRLHLHLHLHLHLRLHLRPKVRHLHLLPRPKVRPTKDFHS